MLNNYDYDKYIRSVLHIEPTNSSLFVATKDDFKDGNVGQHPYRSNFFSFGLLKESACSLQVGIEEYHLKKGSLTMVGPGIVRHWVSNAFDMDNITVFFKRDLFQRPFQDNFLLDYKFFKIGANPILELSEEQCSLLNQFLEQLRSFVSNRKMASGLLFFILEYIDSIYNEIQETSPISRNDEVAREFKSLLSKYYRQHKEVGFYADRMNTDPKHLSAILTKTIGKSVKKAIEEMVVFESQSLLKQTSLDIKEIVYLLGYYDPSYFTRFFKKKTGYSPTEYRSRK